MSYKHLVKLGILEFAGTHVNPWVGPKANGWCPMHHAILKRTMATRVTIVLAGKRAWEEAFLATLFTTNDIEALVESRHIAGGPSLKVSASFSPGKRKQAPGSLEHDVLPALLEIEASATVPRKRRTLAHADTGARIATRRRDEPMSEDSDTGASGSLSSWQGEDSEDSE